MACAAVHRAAIDESYRLALDVGAGSAVAAGLPCHHHRMHCGGEREVIDHGDEKARRELLQVSLRAG